MNFVLLEATFLRYFLPLIVEGNKRGIKSTMLVGKSRKYTDPQKCLKAITELSKKYNFVVKDFEKGSKHFGPTFFIEGVGVPDANYEDQKISLVYAFDYRHLYDSYIDCVDYVVFPNESYALAHNKISSKNLYLGSPKYDISFSKKEIIKKYNLTENKKCLVVAPKNKDVAQINLSLVYGRLKAFNFEILVKTRGKDPIQKAHRGDAYFADDSWFPHTTMELMHISDFVVNFDSTAIEECIMMNSPLINFRIKPPGRGGQTACPFLFGYDFSCNLEKNFSIKQLDDAITYVSTHDFSKSFDDCRRSYLHPSDNLCSARILDKIL